tara:strand:+ start:22 stop:198 length:177 start_codon:yes stop_codon:yes gene_type:complete
MEFYEKRLMNIEKMICNIKKENDKLIQEIYEQPTELIYDKYIQNEKRKINIAKSCLNL